MKKVLALIMAIALIASVAVLTASRDAGPPPTSAFTAMPAAARQTIKKEEQ